ncbi:unnamed protein product, partial [Ectocarpus sp. 13 AM-2016]
VVLIAESQKAEKLCDIVVAVYPIRKVVSRTVEAGGTEGANTSKLGTSHFSRDNEGSNHENACARALSHPRYSPCTLPVDFVTDRIVAKDCAKQETVQRWLVS